MTILFPKVAIIILNWNATEETLRCLSSLEVSDYPNDEIIVVDNASTGLPPETIKKKFPDAILIKNDHNLGYAGGNNIGIKHAFKNGAQYVWLLNNDTKVEPQTLSELIKAAETDTRLGLLSPVIYHFADPEKIQSCGAYLDRDNLRIRYLKDLDTLKTISENNLCLWGTALLVKRAVIERIGYIDEDFFAYHEDFEYSLRALRHGFLNRTVLGSRLWHKSHNVLVDEIKVDRPHCIYYKTRNEYWLWLRNLRGAKRIKFFFKYLADIVRGCGYYKEVNFPAGYNACLVGMKDAFQRRGGVWIEGTSFPEMIKKIILWHPYFLADIFELNFKKYFRTKSP